MVCDSVRCDGGSEPRRAWCNNYSRMRAEQSCRNYKSGGPNETLVEADRGLVFEAQAERLEEDQPRLSLVAEWSRLQAVAFLVDFFRDRVREFALRQLDAE